MSECLGWECRHALARCLLWMRRWRCVRFQQRGRHRKLAKWPAGVLLQSARQAPAAVERLAALQCCSVVAAQWALESGFPSPGPNAKEQSWHDQECLWPWESLARHATAALPQLGCSTWNIADHAPDPRPHGQTAHGSSTSHAPTTWLAAPGIGGRETMALAALNSIEQALIRADCASNLRHRDILTHAGPSRMCCLCM